MECIICKQDLQNLAAHGFHHFWNDGVSKLTVSLSVGDDDLFFVEAHQPGAFERREPARRFALSLRDKDLGAILVITGAESSGDARGIGQPEAEAVAACAMRFRVTLEVVPEVWRQGVFGIRSVFEDVTEFWLLALRCGGKFERGLRGEGVLIEAEVEALPPALVIMEAPKRGAGAGVPPVT